MIDAERLLGSLVRNAMGGRRSRRHRRRRRRRARLGLGGRGALGLGLLGVAIASFEHFAQSKGGGPSDAERPPLPPVPGGGGAGNSPLPPLPTATGEASAAENTPASPGGEEPRGEALLLVRAMIAAANADHEVDEEERKRILQAVDEAGLGDDERRFVVAEMERPLAPSAVAEQVDSPELAGQVYLASRMAIEVDSRAESNYLERLAAALGLSGERIGELESLLEGGVDEEA